MLRFWDSPQKQIDERYDGHRGICRDRRLHRSAGKDLFERHDSASRLRSRNPRGSRNSTWWTKRSRSATSTFVSAACAKFMSCGQRASRSSLFACDGRCESDRRSVPVARPVTCASSAPADEVVAKYLAAMAEKDSAYLGICLKLRRAFHNIRYCTVPRKSSKRIPECRPPPRRRTRRGHWYRRLR